MPRAHRAEQQRHAGLPVVGAAAAVLLDPAAELARRRDEHPVAHPRRVDRRGERRQPLRQVGQQRRLGGGLVGVRVEAAGRHDDDPGTDVARDELGRGGQAVGQAGAALPGRRVGVAGIGTAGRRRVREVAEGLDRGDGASRGALRGGDQGVLGQRVGHASEELGPDPLGEVERGRPQHDGRLAPRAEEERGAGGEGGGVQRVGVGRQVVEHAARASPSGRSGRRPATTCPWRRSGSGQGRGSRWTRRSSAGWPARAAAGARGTGGGRRPTRPAARRAPPRGRPGWDGHRGSGRRRARGCSGRRCRRSAGRARGSARRPRPSPRPPRRARSPARSRAATSRRWSRRWSSSCRRAPCPSCSTGNRPRRRRPRRCRRG